MFVATKEIKVIDRKGKMTIFRPGDEVLGFEGWDEVPKRAHLNLEYVKEVKGKPLASTKRTQKGKQPKKISG